MNIGQAIHTHLSYLDDQTSSYRIRVDGGEEMAVLNHEPDHLSAEIQSGSGPSRKVFVNYANITTLEVIDHG